MMATVWTPAPRGRSLLRHRNFRLLWTAETAARVGTSIASIILPLVAIAALSASTFEVALLGAMIWLPWLLVGLPAGAWVDRLPPRPILITCNAVSILCFISIPLAAGLGVLSIGLLLSTAFVAGTAAVFYSTASQVYLPTLVRRVDLPEGNAKLQGSTSAVQVLGPGVGGVIAQALGAVAALLVNAAMFFISAVCLLAVRNSREKVTRYRPTGRLTTVIKDGLRFVVRDPYLRTLTIHGAVSNLALSGNQAVMIVLLVRIAAADERTVGAIFALISLGGVGGAACATWLARRFGTAHGLLLSQVTAPFALLMPLGDQGPRLAFVAVGGMLVAAGVVVSNVIRVSFRQAYCPGDLLGRVTVSMQFLNYGTIPLGAVLGGSLGSLVGVRATLWTTTSLFALCMLILILSPVRRERNLPAQR